MPESFDAVVVGAGAVGAACGYFLSEAGVRVLVVDRAGVASGTTGAGEGNLLVSDKPPGPELDLALLSNGLWRDLAERIGDDAEVERKGGLVVARKQAAWPGLTQLADAQRAFGVESRPVAPEDLPSFEPHLAGGLAGGMHYPQDLQVQPMLAAAHLLRLARASGASVRSGCEVRAIVRAAGGAVTAVETSAGRIATAAAVNAAGTWGAEVAERAGTTLPILPRRGFILVTEPLPRVVRHKVYTADYVANVASGSEGLETSSVVEGTKSGTVLIGATRERVGFDRSTSWLGLGRIAAQAVALFPFLSRVRVIRAYSGFRPYCPDHLPVIGPDPRVPGLFHACGHEGAGIGLAPATGLVVTQALTEATPAISLSPFAPERFGG